MFWTFIVLSNWDLAMSYFVLDISCTWCKVSLYSTLKVCSISRLLCNIQIHWSSSSGCRRKRSSSFSTTWRGARRSTWQLRHSRNRVGGSTPSTWCGSNATRSPRRSTKSLRWSVYLVSWQYYKGWSAYLSTSSRNFRDTPQIQTILGLKLFWIMRQIFWNDGGRLVWGEASQFNDLDWQKTARRGKIGMVLFACAQKKFQAMPPSSPRTLTLCSHSTLLSMSVFRSMSPVVTVLLSFIRMLLF